MTGPGYRFVNSKEQGKLVEMLNGNSWARKAFLEHLWSQGNMWIYTQLQLISKKSISGAGEACGRAQCPPLLPVGVSVPNHRDSLESTLADIRSHIEAVPQTLDAAYFAFLGGLSQCFFCIACESQSVKYRASQQIPQHNENKWYRNT